MRITLTLLMTLLMAAPAGAVSGGSTLPIEQAPYVAYLGGRCTGTLISPTRILTAAHCLDGQSAGDANVIVGADGLTTFGAARAAHRVAVAGYSIDPKFKESFPFAHKNPSNAIAINDVGLILLKTPVTGITPVRVAGPGDAALEAPGTAVTLIGYGETTTGLPQSLQQGTVSVIGAADCAKAYPHAITATMFCTEDVAHHDPLIQACAGDSGGPTILNTPGGPVQIGVTSWGPEVKNNACGDAFLPEVPMRLSSFSAFINQPDPVIEPFARGKGGAGLPRISGSARVGGSVTCTPPKLGGDAAKLSYSWVLSQGVKFETIKGAHSRTLTVTRALYDHAQAPRPLFCDVVARNHGGSLDLLSGSVRLKK